MVDSPSSRTPERAGVVTGAASGIGRATALHLLHDGVAVIAVDINPAAADELQSAGAQFVQADVASPEGRAAVAAAARALPRGLSHVVNAAGVIDVTAPLRVTVEGFRRVFSVNVEGLYFLTQELEPLLNDGASIVNLSSSSAKLTTTVEVAPYAASKAAVLSLTRTLALTLAPRRIRVNAICPGIVDTPMERSVLAGVGAVRGIPVDQLSEGRDASVPLGRGSAPEEVAGAIAFLLSDAAAYITGEAMNFSGGQVVW